MSADKIEYDERLLATLTDEERAAIEGGDSTPDERAALQELAGDAVVLRPPDPV